VSDLIFSVSPTELSPRLDPISVPCQGRGDELFAGQGMDKLYLGLGAAVYLMFVAWCIITPQK
jgi:hypothetical protein